MELATPDTYSRIEGAQVDSEEIGCSRDSLISTENGDACLFLLNIIENECFSFSWKKKKHAGKFF